MKTSIKYSKNSFLLLKLILITFFLFPIVTNAQVDKRWLESWNEANEKRPIKISSKSRIAEKNEPGVPLIIQGKIFNPNGTPAINVIVHSYHRDVQGFDFGKNDKTLSTWRLQGWAKTDKNGNFEFKTIRPAPDYLGREGAHIHFTTVSERYGKQWAPKIFFDDDPMTTDLQRSKSKNEDKHQRVCKVHKVNGIEYVEVNIKLRNRKDF